MLLWRKLISLQVFVLRWRTSAAAAGSENEHGETRRNACRSRTKKPRVEAAGSELKCYRVAASVRPRPGRVLSPYLILSPES